nr:hypothetical protein [Tanacetum cinerariifolium]
MSSFDGMSSNSDGPSWGITLINADELPKMDPYEEVFQRGQVPPLSPSYKPNLIDLDEHVPVYVLEPKHPEYHEDTNEDSIDYLDEPEDGEEDDELDPEEDPSEEHEPEDEDTKEEEPFEGSDKTEPFEEDETAVTSPPHKNCEARISAPLGYMTAMIRMRDNILKEDMPPQRRFILTAPLPGCDVAKKSAAVASRKPKGQYDFVDTVVAGQSLVHSLNHDARTIARVADRIEDVGHVRALHASEHKMMTSIKEVNLRISC